jgi:hypothetical protein
MSANSLTMKKDLPGCLQPVMPRKATRIMSVDEIQLIRLFPTKWLLAPCRFPEWMGRTPAAACH